MNDHNIGGIIWAVILVFGAIAQIAKAGRRNAKRSASAPALQQQTQSRMVQALVNAKAAGSAAEAQALSARYLAQRALLQGGPAPLGNAPLGNASVSSGRPQPVQPSSNQWSNAPAMATLSAPPPVITPRAVAAPKPVAKAPKSAAAPRPTSEPWHQEPTRPAGYRGFLFEEKSSLVRGIIAAEVLGAPLALREGSFWSQQHNGRSI